MEPKENGLEPVVLGAVSVPTKEFDCLTKGPEGHIDDYDHDMRFIPPADFTISSDTDV